MPDRSTVADAAGERRECSALECRGARWADRPFCKFHWQALEPIARQPMNVLLSKQNQGQAVEHGTWHKFLLPLVIQIARIEGRLPYQTRRRREYSKLQPLRPWE